MLKGEVLLHTSPEKTFVAKVQLHEQLKQTFLLREPHDCNTSVHNFLTIHLHLRKLGLRAAREAKIDMAIL
jgi:hypothetical protein